MIKALLNFIKLLFARLFTAANKSHGKYYTVTGKLQEKPVVPDTPPAISVKKEIPGLWKFSPDGVISFQKECDRMPVPDFQAAMQKLHLMLDHLEQISFPFHINGTNSSGVHFLSQNDIPGHPIWFIGDVHGDYPAISAVCEYIFQDDPNAVVCFCGDLIDRGQWSLETVTYVLQMLFEKKGQILWLKGNHEDGLKYREEAPSCFVSKVQPAGFDVFLNEHPEYSGFGKDLIRFFKMLPTALFFPDGLLFTHAGVPMDDLLPHLTNKTTFSDQKILTDFSWIRIGPDVERKKVSRVMKGNSAGRVNIDEFFSKCADLGIKANRIVAGHIHPVGGYMRAFERYAHENGPRYPQSKYLQSATILHCAVTPELLTDGPQPIAMARYVAGEKPAVKLLNFDKNVLNCIYKFQGENK